VNSAANDALNNKKDALHGSLFLTACRREPTARPPLWIMRQAGRYLPEYREIRSKTSFLQLCKTPELASEVTVAAQEALGVDAAILFADILLIAEPLGFQLQFKETNGPVIPNPIRENADLKRLKKVNVEKDLDYVLEAVRKIRARLKPDIPLIGFAGAPFTLASYLIEGGGSKDYRHLKTFLAKNIASWDEFMSHLVTATLSYLNAQIASGAQAVQLFDSWVGVLSPQEFKQLVLPYLKLLIKGLNPGVPVIYFGTQTAPFFPYLKETGATVIGVDWRVDLDRAWKELGDVAIQGNLDPNVLLTTPDNVREKTIDILKKAGRKPGHIFNLGHGILPQTPMENVKTLIETVKKW
jgi:uroporphyrinogen decarboxylase